MVPLPLPAAGPGPAAPAFLFPPNFPANRAAMVALTGPDCTALLQAYGRPAGGSRIARINRLAVHIGMRSPIV